MARDYNENLRRVLRLAREMIALADEGDNAREDDTCGILYGVLRDMGYKVRNMAQEECERHKEAGNWDREIDT